MAFNINGHGLTLTKQTQKSNKTESVTSKNKVKTTKKDRSTFNPEPFTKQTQPPTTTNHPTLAKTHKQFGDVNWVSYAGSTLAGMAVGEAAKHLLPGRTKILAPVIAGGVGAGSDYLWQKHDHPEKGVDLSQVVAAGLVSGVGSLTISHLGGLRGAGSAAGHLVEGEAKQVASQAAHSAEEALGSEAAHIPTSTPSQEPLPNPKTQPTTIEATGHSQTPQTNAQTSTQLPTLKKPKPFNASPEHLAGKSIWTESGSVEEEAHPSVQLEAVKQELYNVSDDIRKLETVKAPQSEIDKLIPKRQELLAKRLETSSEFDDYLKSTIPSESSKKILNTTINPDGASKLGIDPEKISYAFLEPEASWQEAMTNPETGQLHPWQNVVSEPRSTTAEPTPRTSTPAPTFEADAELVPPQPTPETQHPNLEGSHPTQESSANEASEQKTLNQSPNTKAEVVNSTPDNLTSANPGTRVWEALSKKQQTGITGELARFGKTPDDLFKALETPEGKQAFKKEMLAANGGSEWSLKMFPWTDANRLLQLLD